MPVGVARTGLGAFLQNFMSSDTHLEETLSVPHELPSGRLNFRSAENLSGLYLLPLCTSLTVYVLK